jgi:hypothetical protein
MIVENYKNLLKDLQHKDQVDVDKILPALEKLIRRIFSVIKEKETFRETVYYFDLLNEIQFALAVLKFKRKINFPTHINSFIKNFDRVDDIDLRYFCYKKIRNGSIDDLFIPIW